MIDDGGCRMLVTCIAVSSSENKHPLVEDSMHLYDQIISFMSDNPNRIVPMLFDDKVYTLKDYVEFGLLNNSVVVDLAVEGRTELPNLDYVGLLLFMKQRNTIGLPRCWQELCYVRYAASTVIGKNIVVYDSIGHLLEAYRPLEGTAEMTVHFCFNGTNHFDLYGMSGTYNNEAYCVMREKATIAGQMPQQQEPRLGPIVLQQQIW